MEGLTCSFAGDLSGMHRRIQSLALGGAISERMCVKRNFSFSHPFIAFGVLFRVLNSFPIDFLV